jgi:large subunit ribosomal protein L22
MASATKTNERPGTRAQTKHARVSAYKAREVLDLIRGEPIEAAYEILEFSERDVADIVLGTLSSAVANAEHNDEIPGDELYVSACYADEGPTLRRWRPRARGRATRVRKRTCHITVIVSRFSSDELEARRSREESRGARAGRAASEARRRRVEKSREQKATRRAAEEAAAAEAEVAEDHDHDHDHDHETDVERPGADTEAVGTADAGEADTESEAAPEAEAETGSDTDGSDTDGSDTDESDTDESDTDDDGKEASD